MYLCSGTVYSGTICVFADYDRLTDLCTRAEDAIPDLHQNRATAVINNWIDVMAKIVRRETGACGHIRLAYLTNTDVDALMAVSKRHQNFVAELPIQSCATEFKF